MDGLICAFKRCLESIAPDEQADLLASERLARPRTVHQDCVTICAARGEEEPTLACRTLIRNVSLSGVSRS